MKLERVIKDTYINEIYADKPHGLSDKDMEILANAIREAGYVKCHGLDDELFDKYVKKFGYVKATGHPQHFCYAPMEGKSSGICGQCSGTEFKHAPGIGDYCVKCGFDGQLPYKPTKISAHDVDKFYRPTPEKRKRIEKLDDNISRCKVTLGEAEIWHNNRIKLNELIIAHNEGCEEA